MAAHRPRPAKAVQKSQRDRSRAHMPAQRNRASRVGESRQRGRPDTLPRMPRVFCSLRPGFAVLLLLTGIAAGCSDPLSEVRSLQAKGRFEDSLEPLRKLLATDPDSAEVQFRYGVALSNTGQPGLALWSLRKASESEEWRVPAGLELATGALRSSNWSSAIEAASRVLEADANNVQALLLRAEARLGEKKDPLAALADYDRALELQPENPGIRFSRTSALILADRIEEAAAVFASLEEEGQKASLDAQALGQFCASGATFASERGKPDEAETLFEGCVERYPAHAVVIEQATAFFDQRGKPERSEAILRAALEKRPQALSVREQLAARLRQRGEVTDAERLLRAGLEVEDRGLRAGTWAALTTHFAALDEVDRAADAYEQAMKLAEDPPALAQLTFGDLLVDSGQYDRALELAKGFENSTYRGLIEARVDLARGHPDRALARLDTLLPSWPDNAGARYYAARAAEQIGDFDRAILEYRQSIRSGAEQTDAGLRLAHLLAARGALEDAWLAVGYHMRAHPTDVEGVRTQLRLTARMKLPDQTKALLQSSFGTALWSRVVAARADMLAARMGPGPAIRWIDSARGVDLASPQDAELLRSLVASLAAAKELARARTLVETALASHPEVATYHEIRGLLLEAEGAPAERAVEAYARAVELDPKQARALEALGRLAEQRAEVDAALSWYDRSFAADPNRVVAIQRAAVLAATAGRGEAAEQRWDALLREHPWDGHAAEALARLRLARGEKGPRTLELARRSARFGGGPAAKALLAELEPAPAEPKPTADRQPPSAPAAGGGH